MEEVSMYIILIYVGFVLGCWGIGFGGLRGVFFSLVCVGDIGCLLFVLSFFLILDGLSGREVGFLFEGCLGNFLLIGFGIGLSVIFGWFLGVLVLLVVFGFMIVFWVGGGYFLGVFLVGDGGSGVFFGIFVWFFGWGGLVGLKSWIGFVIVGGLEVWFKEFFLLFFGGYLWVCSVMGGSFGVCFFWFIVLDLVGFEGVGFKGIWGCEIGWFCLIGLVENLDVYSGLWVIVIVGFVWVEFWNVGFDILIFGLGVLMFVFEVVFVLLCVVRGFLGDLVDIFWYLGKRLS